MGIATLLLIVQTIILLVASLLLLYPVIAYAWNVAYTVEILFLAASFIMIAGAYVTGIVVELPVISGVLDLGSATASFWAMWRLADRFIDAETDTVSMEVSESGVEGGFSNADADDGFGNGDVDDGFGSTDLEDGFDTMDSSEVSRSGD